MVYLGPVVIRDELQAVAGQVSHGVYRGHPVLLVTGQPNVGVGHAQGRGKLVPDELIKRPAIDPADQLGDHPAKVDGMICDFRARSVDGRGPLHRSDYGVPIKELIPGQVLWGLRKPALVGQDVPYGDASLAVGGELRPVFGHRVIPDQLAALPQDVKAGRGQGLGGGVKDEHGVLGHPPSGILVGDTGVQVQDRLPVAIDRQGSPRMHVFLYLLLEKLLDPGQSVRVHPNAARCHHHGGSSRYAPAI